MSPPLFFYIGNKIERMCNMIVKKRFLCSEKGVLETKRNINRNNYSVICPLSMCGRTFLLLPESCLHHLRVAEWDGKKIISHPEKQKFTNLPIYFFYLFQIHDKLFNELANNLPILFNPLNKIDHYY